MGNSPHPVEIGYGLWLQQRRRHRWSFGWFLTLSQLSGRTGKRKGQAMLYSIARRWDDVSQHPFRAVDYQPIP